MSCCLRIILTTSITLLLYFLSAYQPLPLWNVLLFFMAFICISTWIRWGYKSTLARHYALDPTNSSLLPRFTPHLSRMWGIAVTFTFITFTRLFFRSGSNLDPAIANETAWRIARQMVEAIGTRWDVNILSICVAYRNIFLLFLFGMIVHWLPTNWKRRYRIWFARMPLPLMLLICVLTVFVVYQFVTAEMQPFIYFQF